MLPFDTFVGVKMAEFSRKKELTGDVIGKPPNKALQRMVNPLRDLSAAELGR